ncbi:MAG: putative recombination protein U [Prokaryotic dsDNA virus sp.]|nr:MAG: putative recombination protein U [Prokaryotic dsDNA virus sp.]|tara:strand:+ start:13762 stop:14343 length:582 start_codon:yes stop_codon:yes gene_type:complete
MPRIRKSQANRGRSWETKIDREHKIYAGLGLAYIERLHPPFLIRKRTGKGSFEGILLGRGAPDYLVVSSGYTILMDAKETQGKRFPYSKVPEHQAKAFDAIRQRGGPKMHGILLINYAKEDVAVAINWLDIRGSYFNWRRNRKMDLKSPPGVASLSFEKALDLSLWQASSVGLRIDYLPDLLLAFRSRELEED